MEEFSANRFLAMTTDAASKHFGTQGDGNHFFYVGRVASTGQVALVTHHGSRKPGALLYKAGMDLAESHRRAPVAGDAGAQCLDPLRDRRRAGLLGRRCSSSAPGPRRTTSPSTTRSRTHLGAKVKDRFWNEHNFVFRKSDGLFYHAKGATPAWSDFARRLERAHADPAQHGRADPDRARPRCRERPRLRAARRGPQLQPLGLHAPARRQDRGSRWWRSRPRASTRASSAASPTCPSCPAPTRMPRPCAGRSPSSAWPRSSTPSSPIGCIMAGDWQRDAPWRKKKAGRAKQRSRDANGDR